MTAATPGPPVAPLPSPRLLRSTWRYGRVPLIEPLLGARIVPREWPFGDVDGVIGWGRKITGARALRIAERLGIPCLLAEDGFLRSIGLGHAEAALSIVLDDVGVHYDARGPSRLEALVRAGHDAVQCDRARRLAAAWRAGRVSKYNHAREAPGLLAEGDVLVVDQTAGDSSIACGLADAQSFKRMLEAALDEHPRSRVVLKVHPDVISGRKRGHYQQMSSGQSSRVVLQAADAHPPSLIEAAQAVYVVTSQMGFEALLWGKPVRCFGMPFYAGWGLTADDLPPPPRRGPASFESLVHASLIDYPRYLDPETMQRCEVERLLDWMALQRRQRERFPADVYAAGFDRRHKRLAPAFFAGSRVHFVERVQQAPAGACVAVWRGSAVAAGATDNGRTLIHVDPGWLTATHGNAAALPSWLIDRSGGADDFAARPDLERLLGSHAFDAPLLDRARRLRESLCADREAAARAGRPATAQAVLLVAGEPGVDPRPLLRAVRAEAPQARLLYWRGPPGPAVEAERDDDPGDLYDARVDATPLPALLARVDAVHTMGSPAGLQALLRGIPVVCHGCPFYAGWGLTTDRLPVPPRPRSLSLDALTAATLILYPTYLSRVTRRFTTPERVLLEQGAPGVASRFALLVDRLEPLLDRRRRLGGP